MMKKRELNITQKVIYEGKLVTIVDFTQKEIIVENEDGKRFYTSAGCLSLPKAR